MSSHPYVSQQNTPLDDDITLMSTTDLQSYITHANDTFVQVSGYQSGSSSGHAKSGVCGYVVHPEAGRAMERDCEKPA